MLREMERGVRTQEAGSFALGDPILTGPTAATVILAVASAHLVRPFVSSENVVPASAPEPIVPASCQEVVIPLSTKQSIVPVSCDEFVIAAPAIEPRSAVECRRVETVVARSRTDPSNFD
ncbi:MAG TPA: hypothetical protein VF028_13670 [Actinomycetota bacterium]|jgi:hypothetical protein|nr:hypothetical protein [Actinomycetota bacterium]